MTIKELKQTLNDLNNEIAESDDLEYQKECIRKRDDINVLIGVALATGDKGLFLPELSQGAKLSEIDPCMDDARDLLEDIEDIWKDIEILQSKRMRQLAERSIFDQQDIVEV